MPFLGMDTQAVQQLSQQMQHDAQQIEQIMQSLTQKLSDTSIWVGPDRNQFVNEWNGTHCVALRNVIQGLNDAANRAMHNAQQQEQTSNVL